MSSAANIAKGVARAGTGMLNPVGFVEFGAKITEDPLGVVKGATIDQFNTVIDPSKPLDQRAEAFTNLMALFLPMGKKAGYKLAEAANATKFAKELGINPVQAWKILKELDKVIASEPQLRTAVERTQYASPANAVPVETPAPGTSGPTRRPTISRGPGKTVLKKRKPTMIPEVVPDTPAPVVTMATAVNAVPESPQLATFKRPGTNNPLLPSEIPDANLANYITEAQARLNEAQKTRPPEEVAVIAKDLNKLKAEQARRQTQPAPTEPVPVAPETPVVAPEPATPVSTSETPVTPPTPIVEPITVPETPGKPIDPTGAPQLGKRGEPGVMAASNLGMSDFMKSLGLEPVPQKPRGRKATTEEVAGAFDELSLDAAVREINDQVANGQPIRQLSEAEVKNFRVQTGRDGDLFKQLNEQLSKLEPESGAAKELTGQIDRLSQKIIDRAEALYATGSATARALAARNHALISDYSTVGIYNRIIKRNKGKASVELIERVKKKESEAGSTTDTIENLENQRTKRQAEKNFDEVKKEAAAKGTRVSTKEQVAAITARLKTTALEALAAAQKAARQSGPNNLGLQALSDATVAVAPYVKQMVKDAVELGAVTFKGASDIVRKQFEDAGFDLTEQQVTEIVAGKMDAPKPKRDKTVYQQITQEARRIIAKQYKAVADAEKAAIAEARKSDPNFAKTAEEIAKDVAKQRVAFLKRQEVLIRQGEIRKWKKEQAAQAKVERLRIIAARKRGKAFEDAARREYKEFWQNSVEAQRERIVESIAKVGKGRIGPPKPPRKKFEDDPEVQRLNAELEKKKKEVGTWQDSVQAARQRLQKRIDDLGKEKKERPKRNEYLDDPEIKKLNAEFMAKQESLAAAKKAKVEAEKATVEYARKRLRERLANIGKPRKKAADRPNFEDDPEIRELTLQIETKKLAVDRELAKIEQERVWREMTPAQRNWERLFAVGDAARTVVASFDFGAAANQGLFYSLSHPFKSTKFLAESIVRGWTRKGTDKVLADVRQDPYFEKARAGKLGIDAVYGDRIDDYLNINEKITEAGGAFNPLGVSQRAMDIYLARVRMDMFKEYAKSIEKGKTLTLKDYKEIAEVVNTLTGTNRYNLGVTGKVASATFFAPKYTIARVETALMTPVLKNIKRNPKLALKAAGDYLKGSVSILGLKLAADALLAYNNPDKTKKPPKTNVDPRSNKFMTAEANNISVKLTGNLLQTYQLLRQITESAVNEGTQVPYQNGRKLDTTMKIGRDGKPRPTEKYSEFTASDADEAVGRFLGQKLSPVAGTLRKLAKGEDFGKKYNLSTNEGRINTMLSFAPILGQNGIDIVNDKRLTQEQKALTIFAAVFNAPVQPTFDKEKYAKPKPPPKL
jgi:hypothetical protein